MERGLALRPVALLLLLSGLFPTLARSAAAGDAWSHLWANRNPEATQAARAALQQNPADAPALRALSVLHLLEDRPVAAAQALRRLYPAAAGHWTGAGYWEPLVTVAEEAGSTALLDQVCKELLASSGAPSILKDSARELLARRAERAGRFPEAQAQRAPMGILQRWRVIGPFPNVSRSGLDKRYAPEREIKSDATYPGRHEIGVRWHPLRLVSREGRCSVQGALDLMQPGTYYAATAIQSPEAREVRLGFRPEGASKLWVNGRLVLRDEVIRPQVEYLSDLFYVQASLRKGWNTVLVKLTAEPPYEAAFRLRVSGKAGEALPGLVVDPAQASGSTETDTAPPAEVEIVRALREPAQAGDAEAWALIVRQLAATGDREAATDAARRGLSIHPNNGWLRWLLSQSLAFEGQQDDARAEREQVIRLNPRILPAQVTHAEENHDSLEPGQYIQKLRALIKYNSNSPTLRWALSHAYSDADMSAACVREGRAALKAAPGAGSYDRLVSLLGEEGGNADALEALRYKTHPNLLEQLGGKAVVLGFRKPSAAIPVYQRLLQLDASEVGWRTGLSSAYQEAGNKKAAVTHLRAARQMCPQNSSTCVQLADLLIELGSRAEALDLYREAIRLDPAQTSLREKLQFLLKEQPVMDLAPPTPVEPLIAAARKVKDAGASALVLLDEGRTVVYPDYATVTRTRYVVKLLDQAAVERFQQIPLNRDSADDRVVVEKARLIKPDGKVQEFTRQLGDGAVAFPSAAVGDIIDLSQRSESFSPGGLSGQFWGQWSFSQSNAASRLSRLVLITPPSMSYEVRPHGPIPPPEERQARGWRIREWKMTDIEPEPSELMEPAGHAGPRTWLDYSSVSSWQDIVRWYQDLSRARFTPDAAIRERALELTRDAKTEDEKLRAIVRFVQDIQYQTTPFRMSAFVPTEGKQVLRERYGDCKDKAALLTALLAAVGIRSRMVLITGRSSGGTHYLPSPRFNHAVALVDTARGPLWVDATADQIQFRKFPFDNQEVPALVIDDRTTDLVLTPAEPIDENQMREVHQGSMDAAGGYRGSSRFEFHGTWSWVFRSGFRSAPRERLNEALETMARALMEQVRYEKGSIDALDERDAPLSIQLAYESKAFASPAGSFLLARLPWGHSDSLSQDGRSLKTGKPRISDVELGPLRGLYTGEVRLDLPPGYTLEDLRPEVRGESPFGSYRFTYRLDGNTLVAQREVRFNTFRVAAADADKLIEFLDVMSQELRRQHVFKKR